MERVDKCERQLNKQPFQWATSGLWVTSRKKSEDRKKKKPDPKIISNMVFT